MVQGTTLHFLVNTLFNIWLTYVFGIGKELYKCFITCKKQKVLVLQYRGKEISLQLLDYSNGDGVGCMKTCHPMDGYVFMLGGTTITWSSKK